MRQPQVFFHCTPTLHCPRNNWASESSDVVLRDTIFHQDPYTPHTQKMPGNGDVAGRWGGEQGSGCSPHPATGLGSPWARRVPVPALPWPSIHFPVGEGKNPETTTEMHLPLLLKLEPGPPRMASFSTQGKGARRKAGGPSTRCTQLSTERDGQTAAALCPGLSCSSIPRPHCPVYATTTRDCSIAAPTQ